MEKTNNELNTTSKTSSEFKRPVKVFRSGMIQASLWENQTKEGKPFLSITFKKGWLDKVTGEWKNTQNFSQQDMGNLMIVSMSSAQYVNGEGKRLP